MTGGMRWARKIGDEILTEQNKIEKRKQTHRMIFGLLKIGNMIHMVFDLFFVSKHMQVRSYFIYLIA
jgi:hypothetical protein